MDPVDFFGNPGPDGSCGPGLAQGIKERMKERLPVIAGVEKTGNRGRKQPGISGICGRGKKT